MTGPAAQPGPGRAQWLLVAAALSVAVGVPLLAVDQPVQGRAAIIALVCLSLWLSGVVPAFVPTLVLWVGTPLLLGRIGSQFALPSVLGWSADPVLALFFGGFALSVAATRHRIDERIASIAARLSGGHRVGLIAVAAAVTALLSMWMSNIAAAAMMLAALRPIHSAMPRTDTFRRALLLSVALGANFGGIATPIGSGPNAIALAAASRDVPVTFFQWMIFGVPLAGLLTAAAIVLLAWRFAVKGRVVLQLPAAPLWSGAAVAVVVVFLATVAVWLTESLHGLSAATVSLGAAAVLFASGLLTREDIARIDWPTLMLIGGGLALGRLLEQSGLIANAAAVSSLDAVPRVVALFALVVVTATLSAVMSNTATATMLVPLAAAIEPSQVTVILVAVAASLGVPFMISTPPNAMAYGEGGLTVADLLVPGLILMVGGCLLIALTGPAVLGLVGIP